MSATGQSEIAVIGIDIGKNTFHVVGLQLTFDQRLIAASAQNSRIATTGAYRRMRQLSCRPPQPAKLSP
jgi:hypothetical protein